MLVVIFNRDLLVPKDLQSFAAGRKAVSPQNRCGMEASGGGATREPPQTVSRHRSGTRTMSL